MARVMCPACEAEATPQAARDGWCENCGKRLPAFVLREAGVLSDPGSRPPEPLDAADPVAPPPSAEEVASDRRNAVRVAVTMSIGVYAVLTGVLFAPEVRAKAVEAFGREPLGLPATVFAGLLQTLLYLPMPRAFYHFALIGEQAQRDGRVLLGLGSFLYVAKVDRRHPHLTRSRRICLGTLGYFIAVVTVWIVYTAMRGI